MSERVAAWLEIAAEEKADNIVRLTPTDVRSVVEIGSGTGAVLRALGRRDFAEEYWACEPAPDLARLIQSQAPPQLCDVSVAEFDEAFEGRSFDLAILSHVVEHVLAPAVLIHQALRRSRYVLVEVPIEANCAGRSRMAIKRLASRSVPAHPAGHIQFFSRRTARQLVRHAGGQLLNEAGYFPRSAYAAQADQPYHRAVLAAARWDLLARSYYEHFAMLVRPTPLTAWDHHYARPRL